MVSFPPISVLGRLANKTRAFEESGFIVHLDACQRLKIIGTSHRGCIVAMLDGQVHGFGVFPVFVGERLGYGLSRYVSEPEFACLHKFWPELFSVPMIGEAERNRREIGIGQSM